MLLCLDGSSCSFPLPQLYLKKERGIVPPENSILVVTAESVEEMCYGRVNDGSLYERMVTIRDEMMYTCFGNYEEGT